MNCQRITTRSALFDKAKILLGSYDLDSSDITDGNVALWALDDEGELAGVVGFEQSMDIGLLRSLAVADDRQGEGLATQLCDVVFEYAQTAHIDHIYLLTESASSFFERLGFASIHRDQVPEGLRLTRQFSALCPDDATVMVRS